jgi:hypothetical protein
VRATIGTIAEELSSPGSDIYQAAERASGSKALLKSALKVAFPLTYQNNPDLQRILGDNGLIDREAILRAYTCIQSTKQPCGSADKNLADEIVKNPTDAHVVGIQARWYRHRKNLITVIDNAPYDQLEPSLRRTSVRLRTLLLLYEARAGVTFHDPQ